ncbi:MAG: thioesterase family protein [Pseudomonadota bacterium]
MFRTQIPVRFADCDPAGIVFFPRYYEMANAVVEDWFAGPLGYDFNRLHVQEDLAVPAVHMEATFHAPSRIGDLLEFSLKLLRLGQSSFTHEVQAVYGGEPRFTLQTTSVMISKSTGRPMPIAGALRAAMQAEVAA